MTSEEALSRLTEALYRTAPLEEAEELDRWLRQFYADYLRCHNIRRLVDAFTELQNCTVCDDMHSGGTCG